jgi:sugar lactone lactonase YvrE
MYYADSYQHAIWAFDFEPDNGVVRNRRVFVEIPAADGVPDGATVDREGGVWVAQWDGWRVTRYDPKGRLDRVVTLPVQRPTCPMFGGANLDVVYVTSASIGLTAEEQKQQPLAGGLFAFDPGIKGLPEAHFLG